MVLVQLFLALLDVFTLRLIWDCGEGSDCGKYNSGVEDAGICSRVEMGLVA